MTDNFPIFFDDLHKEAQERLLEFLGVDTPEELNLDEYPLAIIEIEEDDEEDIDE